MSDRVTRGLELAARLAGQAPSARYSKMAAGADDLLPLQQYVGPPLAKPDRTMGRFEQVLEERGLEPMGSFRESLRSPSPPEGVDPQQWAGMLRTMSLRGTSTGRAQVYAVDPVAAVASQYPADLRDQAIQAAREFLMPLRHGGGMRWQGALEHPNPRAMVLAHPGRKRVSGRAVGLAFQPLRADRLGAAEVAAGPAIRPELFDSTLLHELRHTLEGENFGWQKDYGGYQGLRLGDLWTPRRKEYLGRTAEEAARLADGRARYAQRTGRLISDPDEADRAAQMILSNERGLGAGFYPDEREFYRRARDMDSNVRDHQNNLLQGLLSLPFVISATQDQ